MQAGGRINNSPNSRARKQLRSRQRNLRRLNKVGVTMSPTMVVDGHSHQMILDENGYGKTSGHNHSHEVRNYEVILHCNEQGKCHSH